jgi:hypothetical protein
VSRVAAAHLIEMAVRRQLPRLVEPKLAVFIASDPWHVRVTVRFSSSFDPYVPGGGYRMWDCDVVPVWREGILERCALPDEFVARLCVEVP